MNWQSRLIYRPIIKNLGKNLRDNTTTAFRLIELILYVFLHSPVTKQKQI